MDLAIMSIYFSYPVGKDVSTETIRSDRLLTERGNQDLDLIQHDFRLLIQKTTMQTEQSIAPGSPKDLL